MRPPWMVRSQDVAELEALQTDVMRFVAILGLCLAAIFSLVHSAAVEQQTSHRSRDVDTPAPPQRSQQVQPSEALSPSAEPESDLSPMAPGPVDRRTRETGFTLEFSSSAALDRLLRSGSVQLYVKLEDKFRKLGASGIFQVSDAPDNYYAMTTDTVPAAYLQGLSGLADMEHAVWGVTLPAGIVEQITALLDGQEKGSLVIDGGGGVKLLDAELP